MTTLDIPLCEWCNDPLPPAKKTGRRRRYCPDKPCRLAAFRHRHLEAYVDGSRVELEPLEDRPANPDESLAQVILEAGNVGGGFLRVADEADRRADEAQELGARFLNCGRVVRPALAWRAEKAGRAILSAIDEYFEER